MDEIIIGVEQVSGFGSLYIDKSSMFRNALHIDWDAEGVSIGTIAKDENEETALYFNLTPSQCKLLSNMLLAGAKQVKKLHKSAKKRKVGKFGVQ